MVLPPRHVNAAFGGMVGYSGADLTASAQAQARDRTLQDCSLCVNQSLTVSGAVDVGGDGSAIARSGRVNSGGHLWLTQAAVDAGAGIGFESWPPSPAPPSARYSPQPERVAALDPFAGTYTQPTPPNINSLDNVTCGTGQSLQTNTVVYRRVTVTGACSVGSGRLFVIQRLRINSGRVADRLARPCT